MRQGYDLIGDIHGCGNTLVKLLQQMGYSKKKWRVPAPQTQSGVSGGYR